MAYSHAQNITRADILTYFGEAGLIIAEQNEELVGLVGWQAENLVARVTDLLVSPLHLCHDATQALLGALEKSAAELQCEVVILLMPFDDVATITQFWQSYGYAPVQIADLPQAWRKAALEKDATREGPILIKKLGEDRVLRPI
jgi:dephospho-CoA kinase